MRPSRRDGLARLADLSMCKRLGWRQYLFLRRCQRFGYRFKYCIERGGTVTPRPHNGVVFCHEFWVARTAGPTGIWYWLWVRLSGLASWAYRTGASAHSSAIYGPED